MPKSSSRSSLESISEFSSLCRQQRNIAEKQRRDKLNGYISELATIVPLVSQASKRLDKTSILRLTAAHIRMYKSVVKGSSSFKVASWRPNFVNADDVKELLEDIEGFLFISSNKGKIIYMSSSVERYLGHQNIDMMGHTLLSFIHPADVEMVQNNLLSLSEAIDKGKSTARCSINLRIREKSQPRSEVVSYQMFHLNGQMTFEPANGGESSSEESRSCSSLLKGFVQLVHSSPFSQVSLGNSISDEYVTCHDTLGRIIQVDQNIATIAGYMPDEVLGKSAYDYIIPEDHSVTAFAQKLMFTSSHGRGLVVYRLRTLTNSRVYLMTSGFIQFDSKTGQMNNFVCVNRLLTEEVGSEELKKFQQKFSPHILKESCPQIAAPLLSPSSPPITDDKVLSPALPCVDTVTSPNSLDMTVNSELFADLNDSILSCSTYDAMEAFDLDIVSANLVQAAEQFSGNESLKGKDSECSEQSNTSSYFSAISEDNCTDESSFFTDVLERTVYLH